MLTGALTAAVWVAVSLLLGYSEGQALLGVGLAFVFGPIAERRRRRRARREEPPPDEERDEPVVWL